MLDNAAVATFLLSPDNRLLYANRAFYSLLGYDANEPVSALPEILVHPDDVAVTRAQFAELSAGRVPSYRHERRYLTKDGTPTWVLVSASALRDERSGRLVYVIVQAIDINGQKKAEAALAESESRWNFALEGAGQGVWDADLSTGKVFYSRMWRVMRGFGPAEAVDSSIERWLARVHPDDRDRIRNIVRRQDSGEIPFNEFEYRERHRDGHWVWILSRGKPMAWASDGRPQRIIGTDTDITDLKNVEAALAGEKERLKVTLQSITDGVISTDSASRVTFMNPAAEQMTGWSVAEAVGRTVGDLLGLTDANTGAAASDPVAECLKTERVLLRDGDTILVSRGGKRRDVRVSACPIRSAEGKVIGAVLVLQDVTSSRAIQRQLAHSAMHDSLTGLPNRQTFDRALADAGEQARRELRQHALCFIDLDRFKAVNDTAGHRAGDALLREVAQTIRANCRATDFAARIGGDEFAMLLPDVSLAQARILAQRVADAIATLSFSWQGKTYEIGASIGVAAVTSQSHRPVDLMSQADAACYVAKASGRNRVSVYDPDKGGLAQLEQSA